MSPEKLSSDDNPKGRARKFKSAYPYYALGVLTVAYICNFVDRQILAILQESIKAELHLMDWQLGLLSGIAFALFYVSVGIPIARWADKANRRNIVSIAIATWSFMTAISGLAQNFVHLLLARIGVAVGEAGGSPPAHSIISDLFPPQKRATALSIYSMGVYFGILCGFVIGGWINDFYGWRMVFFVIGIPGILWALVIRFTLREPPRGQSENVEKVLDAPPMGEVLRLLWSRKSFRHMSLASGLHSFVGYGLGHWIASYFIRTYELTTTGELATWLGLITGLAGASGTFMGGYLTDKCSRRDRRWYMWIPGLAALLAIPSLLLVFILEVYHLALVIYIIPQFLAAMFIGPTIAMTHGVVGLRMRALASSILFFVLNLIGLGLGPLLTGILSDLLTPTFGQEALKYASMMVVFVYLLAAYHFWRASKTIEEDLDNAPK